MLMFTGIYSGLLKKGLDMETDVRKSTAPCFLQLEMEILLIVYAEYNFIE